MHCQLAELQSELSAERKGRERLEVQCHELESEVETMRRSGAKTSHAAETANEVAKYVYDFHVSVTGVNVAVYYSLGLKHFCR